MPKMYRQPIEHPSALTSRRFRRSIFIGGALSLPLTLRPGYAQQPPTTAIRLGMIPTISAAQAFYAEAENFFKKNGLDVSVQTLNNGATIAAAMAAGSLDVGFADVISIANAHLRGIDFAFIAPATLNTSSSPTGGLIIRGDSGLSDGKSLNGKVIAVNAVKSSSTVAIQAWVDGNGGDSSTLKFLEIPVPQMAAAVEQGIVAGAYAGEPYFASATLQGMKVLRFGKGTIAPTYMGGGWFAERQWIAKNSQTVTRFAAAMRDAAAWANSNWSAAQAILATALKIPPQILQSIEFTPQYGSVLRASEIQPVIDAAVRYQALSKTLRAEDIIAQSQR